MNNFLFLYNPGCVTLLFFLWVPPFTYIPILLFPIALSPLWYLSMF